MRCYGDCSQDCWQRKDVRSGFYDGIKLHMGSLTSSVVQQRKIMAMSAAAEWKP